MLHIIGTILKIILWIILCILGLALLLVLLVLFAPISYSADVKYKEDARIKAKVSFLCVSVKVFFDSKTKELSKSIRLFGIPLGRREKSKKKVREEFEESEISEDITDKETIQKKISDTEKLNEEITDKEIPDAHSSDKVISEALGSDDEIISVDNTMSTEADDISEEVLPDETEEDKKTLSDKIKAFCEKLKNIWEKLSPENIMDTIEANEEKLEKKAEDIKRKLKRIDKFLNMSCTIKTRKYLFRYLKSVLMHISPRRIKGYVRFGLKDPASTGKTLGYISMLPFVYQKHFSIYPDFYEKIIEAEVSLKGRIHIGYILRIALKPYIWRTIKLASKLTKDDEAKKNKAKITSNKKVA